MLCERCGFSVQGSHCRISGTPMEVKFHECPFFIPQEQQCAICGNPIPNNQGIIPSETPMLLCNNCGQHLYKCPTCKHNNTCLVNSYDGPLPRTIQQQIRQGPMIQIVETINPAIFDECCPKCPCESITNCKELHTCRNYKFIID